MFFFHLQLRRMMIERIASARRIIKAMIQSDPTLTRPRFVHAIKADLAGGAKTHLKHRETDSSPNTRCFTVLSHCCVINEVRENFLYVLSRRCFVSCTVEVIKVFFLFHPSTQSRMLLLRTSPQTRRKFFKHLRSAFLWFSINIARLENYRPSLVNQPAWWSTASKVASSETHKRWISLAELCWINLSNRTVF